MDDEIYGVADKFVCAECFKDIAIRQFVQEKAEELSCDYCLRTDVQPIAASLYGIVEHIWECISSEWTNPDNEGLSWIQEDEEYIMDTYDARDLITEGQIDLGINNDELLEDILRGLPDTLLCRIDAMYGTDDEVLLWSWDDFSRFVMYQSRYLFLRTLVGNPALNLGLKNIPPEQILDVIGEFITTLRLIYTLETDCEIYRVRIADEADKFHRATELGTLPIAKSFADGRMSSPGIPHFYGAFDEQTALDETYECSKPWSQIATVATFKTMRNLKLLDLAALPSIPSLFNKEQHHLRDPIKFLHAFRHEITKPMRRDGQERIKYVPTQVFTEYIRQIQKDRDGSSIDGIIYPSSRKEGGRCCVLFVSNEECVDTQDQNEQKGRKTLFLQGTKRLRPKITVEWNPEKS